MINVMDNKLYLPEEYLKAATGNKYINISGVADVEFIHKVLKAENIETDESPVWDYPLDEIAHIVENDLQVVLIQCSYKEGRKKKKELRWFECPNGFSFS